MSWTINVPVGPQTKFSERLDEAPIIGVETPPPEQIEQTTAAKAAARAILKSGALGKETWVGALLSGHANLGHTPQRGFSPDTVTVQVYCMAPISAGK